MKKAKMRDYGMTVGGMSRPMRMKKRYGAKSKVAKMKRGY